MRRSEIIWEKSIKLGQWVKNAKLQFENVKAWIYAGPICLLAIPGHVKFLSLISFKYLLKINDLTSNFNNKLKVVKLHSKISNVTWFLPLKESISKFVK